MLLFDLIHRSAPTNWPDAPSLRAETIGQHVGFIHRRPSVILA